EARGRDLVHDRPQALPRVREGGPRRPGDGGGPVAVRGRVPRALVGGRVRPRLPGEPPARGGHRVVARSRTLVVPPGTAASGGSAGSVPHRAGGRVPAALPRRARRGGDPR